MNGNNRRWILVAFFAAISLYVTAQPDDPRQRHYGNSVRSLLKTHCFACHNGEDKKGGFDLDGYFYLSSVIRNGELFQKVVTHVSERTMPPDTKPPLKQMEIDTITFYINSYLKAALAEKNPGLIAPRRLNNQEFKYVIQDLLNIEVDVDSIFPADPSGGGGFDNHADVLYMSPLLIERYFETADGLLAELYSDTEAWRKLVPEYRGSLWASMRNFWYRTFFNKDVSLERPAESASEVLIPFATLAFRGFLSPEDKSRLLEFFKKTYILFAEKEDRFDASIKETMNLILVSHRFLYRMESDPDIEGPYQINNFELASRLSFFLWSSMPDEQLLNVAYREDLHNPEILEREVLRMLNNPKANRLGEQFAVQWLELKGISDVTAQVDPEIFPEYTPTLSALMLKEVELFFNHVLLESKNLLDLIDSNYSFMNEELAQHYGIPDVEGTAMRKVQFTSNERGGVLGMAGVLTATSLPSRTSPVIRGKWVLEQILGTPPLPPPPNVPELEVSKNAEKPVESLRGILERHREDPACHSCHEAMDPIGLGLENFDGIGRWRLAYGDDKIDASGVMASGELFEGPADLRRILLGKKDLFAKNFSRKMLSYALGRSLEFKDTPTIESLKQILLETNFDSERFIVEVAKSYPFRFKKSDTKDVPKKPSA
ncbi:MAG: DUF1592 domain-containing protein [Bacteroidetes bacterium]|nr:DUF1592 domain-containing protein [Bacteroidota bacterium]MDA1119932.1 DUF1592 domain-containing protein [Bacteroidota bacterium]